MKRKPEDEEDEEHEMMLMLSLVITIMLHNYIFVEKMTRIVGGRKAGALMLEDQLFNQHPDHCITRYGMEPELFRLLDHTLGQFTPFADSGQIPSKVHLAIFLESIRTGNGHKALSSSAHRAVGQIGISFKRTLEAILHPGFLRRHVCQPTSSTPTSERIKGNYRFDPFFKDCVGALDGTHVPCFPPSQSDGTNPFRNRKGANSLNVLGVVDFDMRFLYIYGRCEGSAHDAWVLDQAMQSSFKIPAGKFYLADAGYGLKEQLLVPYRNVRYHLKEWARGTRGPQDAKELYNHRHSCARNVVERVFGVLQARFAILTKGSHYDIDVQALIPLACAAIHNFILRYGDADTRYVQYLQNFEVPDRDEADATRDVPTVEPRASTRAARHRDQIARKMWDQRQEYLREQGREDDTVDETEEEVL